MDDSFWRRPSGESGGSAGDRPAQVPSSRQAPNVPYTGPPRTEPPPAGWRPQNVIQPAPPRPLPPQDHRRLDTEEQAARTLTKGIGLLAGAVMLVLLIVVCGRWAF